MTFETDGGGTKGLRWTRDDGTITTLRSAIAKHFTASITTLEVTAKNRTDRLKDFYEFRSGAMRDYARSKIKRIVILPQKDPIKAAELVEILNRSKIEVRQTTSQFSSTVAHPYTINSSAAEKRNLPAGAYVVDLNQPQRILAKALLEPDTPQDKMFVEDNMARFRRNQMKGSGQPKEDYGFYDITSWSLPLAFGLDAYWTEDGGAVGNPVTVESIAAAKRGSYPGRAQIAYVIPYTTDSAAAMAMRLLQAGFRVAVATKQMNAGGRNWPRGTFVVRVGRNPDSVHDAVAKLAVEMGVNPTAVNSGFAEQGDTGVGGQSVISLRPPKIAVVADDAVDQTSFGSIWWTLDRYGIKSTPMTISSMKGGALKDYNVLIMPGGSASRYFAAFGAGGVSTLKDWISDGGTLITVRGGSVFASLKEVQLSSTRLVGSEADEEKDKKKEIEEPKSTPLASPTPPPTSKKPGNKNPAAEPNPNPSSEELPSDKADIAPELPPIASPSADANKVPVPVPGAIMRATVDRTTYLTYGLEQNELPVFLASGFFFRYSKEGSNALVFEANPTRPLTISGFSWEGNTEKLLSGTSYVIDEPNGQGHVILFAEEPFFRGIFRATTRPFFNSILFNGAF
jgi:hypothetical protein